MSDVNVSLELDVVPSFATAFFMKEYKIVAKYFKGEGDMGQSLMLCLFLLILFRCEWTSEDFRCLHPII